jgi:hypothetical protein
MTLVMFIKRANLAFYSFFLLYNQCRQTAAIEVR